MGAKAISENINDRSILKFGIWQTVVDEIYAAFNEGNTDPEYQVLSAAINAPINSVYATMPGNITRLYLGGAYFFPSLFQHSNQNNRQARLNFLSGDGFTPTDFGETIAIARLDGNSPGGDFTLNYRAIKNA